MSTVALDTSCKYLIVSLDGESYGLPVLQVREIIRLQKITPVPQMPEFVNGVINLRGKVIPVIDLRKKFGLKAETTDRTCIVVVQVKLSDNNLPMGLIVDSVEEVVNIQTSEIVPTPEFGVTIDTSFLLGMARIRDQVKTLINIDRIVCSDTVKELAGV